MPGEPRLTTGALVVRPSVRVSYDADTDLLLCLLPGVVIDGHGDDETDEPLDGLFVFRRGEGGPAIGFGVEDTFGWDVLGNAGDDAIWGAAGLRFDAPTLGLVDASIGEIVLAAQRTLPGSTPDVLLFDRAVAAGADGDRPQAETLWRLCLAAGELKAHYGLGYTLVELGRPREAYGHLVTYTELTPRLAWGWSWRGRAALEMGETGEARACLQRALEAEHAGGGDSDAGKLLAELGEEPD